MKIETMVKKIYDHGVAAENLDQCADNIQHEIMNDDEYADFTQAYQAIMLLLRLDKSNTKMIVLAAVMFMYGQKYVHETFYVA